MVKNNLRAEKITRSDGVLTTVWKRATKSTISRLSGIKPPIALSPHALGLHPTDYAFSWNPESDTSPVEPRWWKKYAKETSEFGSKAELIDIIPSLFGDLAVIWQSKAIHKQDVNLNEDSGFNISGIYLYNAQTGKQSGYVKILAMTDESFKNSFGDDEYTNFRYDNRYGDGNYESLNSYDSPLTDITEFRKRVWASAYIANAEDFEQKDGTYLSYHNVSARNAPKDDVGITADLARFAKNIQKRVDDTRSYYSPQHPSIEYSSLPNEMRGAGLGAAMYIYAAKKIAGNGAVLRASGIQSNDSQSLWGKLESTIPEHVGEVKLNYRGSSTKYAVLDFRS